MSRNIGLVLSAIDVIKTWP